MASSTTLRLRALWLSVHKWIGILLAILIIPVSISGAALVWHDGLDSLVNPHRYAVTSDEAALPLSGYADAAAPALQGGERIASIRMPEHGGPVIVSAVAPPQPGAEARPGPPVRANIYLDPADGRVLDHARSDEGIVRFLHVLHGSLFVPGSGRQIVGWVGVFMLISCLTGIWLWWPVTGSVTRGFRWKRQNTINANLHHQMGFWILIPLAMLSFTGVWISFPQFFGGLIGAQQQQGPGGGGGGGQAKGEKGKSGAQKGGGNPAEERARRMRAQPLPAPQTSLDSVIDLARPHGTGPLVSVTWPTDMSAEWQIAFAREGGPAEVRIADATGEATPPRPPQPENTARTMRRWHDGNGMGWIWQFLIFLGGVIPCVLAVTGIIMWLRTRRWRKDLAAKRQAKAAGATPAAAE